jgi:sterol desaturase/sphingolipid hydroxylase (fatty acid hydroxylase superfamily)
MPDFSTAADRLTFYQTALLGSLVLACLWETVVPARVSSPHALWRWLNNLALALLNHTVLLLAIPVVYVTLVQALGWQQQGLLQRWDFHPVVAFGVLFLALEAMNYLMHRLYHAVPLLWRLHAVHHSDTELDFSTAHRHHTGEALLSAVVSVPVLLLLGPDIRVLLVYQVLAVLVVALSHANIRFGTHTSQWLRWVIVTPEFHRVHHSSDVRYTDSHYGTVSPLFDLMLGTAHAPDKVPAQDAEMGLEYFREPRYMRLDRLLAMPLVWRREAR